MLRTSLAVLFISALGASAFAQQDLRSRLRPITTGVKHAGVLHLGTGTWTRAGNQAELNGTPTVVYDNTCSSGYYAGMLQGQVFTDEGSIPNASQLSTPSTAIPGGHDTNPGCSSTYDITGFEIAYCTYFPTTYSVDVSFYDMSGPAGTNCPVPGVATATFNITGLPGSTSLNAQACWVVGFDLLAAPPSTFTLTGTGGAQGDGFSWSYTQVGPSMQNNEDGVFLAGGVGSPSPATCTGTDGTRWDSGTASLAWPNNKGEEGTGMFNLDTFRNGGITNPPTTQGCFWFGGNPRASFHLELYSDVDCSIVEPPGISYCFGDGSTATACPCGNFGAPGAGCNNSIGNGGASLGATGVPSLSNDTLVLTQSGELASSLSIFLQGTTNLPNGLVFGDGVRCVGGSLKRLYVRAASAGTVSAPAAGDPSVSVASAALGDTITAGATRFYGVYYRDASATFCPNPPGNTWNIGNSNSVLWHN
jgi:hypothetical protein